MSGQGNRPQHVRSTSPAVELPRYQQDNDQQRFRTLQEIEEMLARGGLSDEEIEAQWKRLCLAPDQIRALL